MKREKKIIKFLNDTSIQIHFHNNKHIQPNNHSQIKAFTSTYLYLLYFVKLGETH